MSFIYNQKHRLLIVLILSALLSGCGISLAADVTPPPDSQSFSASDRSEEASGSLYPLVPPDPANGKLIYLDKCAACHGALGMGDGPQGLQLSVAVPPLGDPSLARGARPVEWYQMVTEGNLERFMPPFRSLDDRQRWDVVAYALTLSMRTETLEEGQRVYELNCQSCHGVQGEGSQGVSGWKQDSSQLAQMSIMEIASVIAGGKGTMPGFSGQIDPSQIVSAATYARTLSFSDPEPAGRAAAESEAELRQREPEKESEVGNTITVKGQVIHASAQEFPEGLVVTLSGYDDMARVFDAQTTVAEDGTFIFTGIEMIHARTYIASTQFQGMTFNSDAFHNLDQPPGGEINLPIQIYGTTTDSTALRVDRMHLYFEFTNPEVVQVVELFLVNNTSNHVVVDDGSGRGVVSFDLPSGAQNLQFQDGILGGRYLPTERGFADTGSIAPGAGTQILFAYDLPFKRKMDIDISIPLDVEAAIVMLPQGTMDLQSDQLQFMGQRDIQGVMINLYTAAGLQSNSVLEMTLSSRAPGFNGLQGGLTSEILIGVSVFTIAVMGVGYWLYRQWRSGILARTGPEAALEGESIDELMDAIIALDDRYKAGEIPEGAYLQRRTEIKDRLKGQVLE